MWGQHGKVTAGVNERGAPTCQGVGAGLAALKMTMSLELAAAEVTDLCWGMRRRRRTRRAGINTCVKVREQVWAAEDKGVTCEWRGAR